MKTWKQILICTLMFTILEVLMQVGPAEAQSYSTINSKLKLYCADLPNNTKSLARLQITKTGEVNVELLDGDTEIEKIRKVIKKNQKRINTLKKIRQENSPSENVQAYINIYKYVFEKPFTGSADKMIAGINKLIKALNEEIADLEDDLVNIDLCLRGELPPPEAGTAQVINLEFIHPDFNVPYHMFGLGFTGRVAKKAISGSFCVSAAKAYRSVPKFPYEAQWTTFRNPCSWGYQTNFRNWPFCSASQVTGIEHSVLGWFDVGYNEFGPDEDELEDMQEKLADIGPINIRVPTPKSPCRKKS